MTRFRAIALAVALSSALASPAMAASPADTYRVPTSDPNTDQVCFYLSGSTTPVCDRQVNKTTGVVTVFQAAMPTALDVLAVTTANVLSALSHVPNGGRFLLFVNGQAMPSSCTSIAGTAVTWVCTAAAGGFDLATTDVVQASYSF